MNRQLHFTHRFERLVMMTIPCPQLSAEDEAAVRRRLQQLMDRMAEDTFLRCAGVAQPVCARCWEQHDTRMKCPQFDRALYEGHFT